MINGINLPKLRNAEFDQFIRDVLVLVARNDQTALNVKAEYDALKGESDRLSEMLNPQRGSAITSQLEAADLRRDNCISGINLVVSAYLNHFDDTLRQHAEALDRHLTIYGKSTLARENYQSETAGINSMLKDWDSQEHLNAALTALHLNNWVAELAEANLEFSDLYIGRTEEASAASTDTVRSLRLSMVQNYYRLRDLLGAYHMINKGADPWGNTVKQINVLINKYEALTGEPRSGATAGGTETTAPEAPQIEQ